MTLPLDALPDEAAAEVRCSTCTSPDRRQIEELISAGYPVKRIVAYLTTQGVQVASGQALGNHKRNHMLAPDDPAGITTLALARGGRDLKNGRIRLNATSLAHFVRLQRDLDQDRRSAASEELAARCVNHLLTVMRPLLGPELFHEIRELAWPGLMDLVGQATGDGGAGGSALPGVPAQAPAPGAAYLVPQDGQDSAGGGDHRVPPDAVSEAPGVIVSVPQDGASEDRKVPQDAGFSAAAGGAGKVPQDAASTAGGPDQGTRSEGSKVPGDAADMAPVPPWLRQRVDESPEGGAPLAGGPLLVPEDATSEASDPGVPPWLRRPG